MKNILLVMLLVSSVIAQGQSLKDALYSGKLKSQPGTVIRKGDDLSKLMDTAQKAPGVDSVKATAARVDSSAGGATVQVNPPAAGTTVRADSGVVAQAEPGDSVAVTTEEAAAPAVAAPAPKDNNAAWREYMNSVIAALKTEVLTSKKIKKDTYFATVSYTIEPDGQVTVSDVVLTPDNELLKKQIKERVSMDAPRLNPVLSSSGAPRKVNRKYNFSLTKE